MLNIDKDGDSVVYFQTYFESDVTHFKHLQWSFTTSKCTPAFIMNIEPCLLHTCAHLERARVFTHTELAAINPQLTKTKPHGGMFVG